MNLWDGDFTVNGNRTEDTRWPEIVEQVHVFSSLSFLWFAYPVDVKKTYIFCFDFELLWARPF